MVINRQLDFASHIFDHLVETISGKQRPTYLTFPRWIALCLQHIGTGYVGEPEDAIPFSTMSTRLINAVSQDDDPRLTNNKISWIEHPYFENPRPVNYVPPAEEPL